MTPNVQGNTFFTFGIGSSELLELGTFWEFPPDTSGTNLSSYNTRYVDKDGTIYITEYSSGNPRHPYVKARVTIIYTDGRKEYYETSIGDPSRAADMGAGIAPRRCFPSGTLVSTLSGDRAIEDICVGDFVWSFNPEANRGRGELGLKRVTRLYRNETQAFIRLSWQEQDEATGEMVARELVATPGHHFLDSHGDFLTLEQTSCEVELRVV